MISTNLWQSVSEINEFCPLLLQAVAGLVEVLETIPKARGPGEEFVFAKLRGLHFFRPFLLYAETILMLATGELKELLRKLARCCRRYFHNILVALFSLNNRF